MKSLLEILAAPIQQHVHTETYGLCSTNSLGTQIKAQGKFSFFKLAPVEQKKLRAINVCYFCKKQLKSVLERTRLNHYLTHKTESSWEV